MATVFSPQRRVYLGLAMIVAVVLALAGMAGDAKADPLLAAPTVLSGPAEGSTITTDSADFVFQYLDPITGGSLAGFVCTVDGAAPVACDDGLSLVGLAAGAHTVGVKAVIDLVGGTPVCVLTVCIDPGPVSVDTDLLTRTFNVDLSGTSVGTGGQNGADGTNGSEGAGGNSAGNDRATAFLAAWVKYKHQRALCTRMKDRIKKYKSHARRMRAAKKYKTCFKRQKKLRAAALAIA